MHTDSNSNWLALDVGNRRIGVAIAGVIAQLPRPLITLENSPDVLANIGNLVKEHSVQGVVVGLPRNMSGNETAQSAVSRSFATQLQHIIAVPVILQDETLTSVKAETELAGRSHNKGDIDALAATYILEDFLSNKRMVKNG